MARNNDALLELAARLLAASEHEASESISRSIYERLAEQRKASMKKTLTFMRAARRGIAKTEASDDDKE